MQIAVTLHGELTRFLASRDRAVVEVPEGSTVSEALRRLGVPANQVWMSAVNGDMVAPDTPLKAGDSLEVVAPVAGGAR